MNGTNTDAFSDENWALGQYRGDWARCASIEANGSLPTVWPLLPTWRDHVKPAVEEHS